MNCLVCGGKMTVINSRAASKGVRRRRNCKTCGHRETTIEHTEETLEALFAARFADALVETKKHIKAAWEELKLREGAGKTGGKR